MSTIAGCILTAALLVLILSSDITPWKIVSQSELESLHNQIAEARNLAAKVKEPERQHGSWMWDPAYKSPLDKKPASANH